MVVPLGGVASLWGHRESTEPTPSWLSAGVEERGVTREWTPSDEEEDVQLARVPSDFGGVTTMKGAQPSGAQASGARHHSARRSLFNLFCFTRRTVRLAITTTPWHTRFASVNFDETSLELCHYGLTFSLDDILRSIIRTSACKAGGSFCSHAMRQRYGRL